MPIIGDPTGNLMVTMYQIQYLVQLAVLTIIAVTLLSASYYLGPVTIADYST